MRDKTVTLRNDEPCLNLDNTNVWRNPAEPPTKVSKKKSKADTPPVQQPNNAFLNRDIKKATVPIEYQQSRFRNNPENCNGYNMPQHYNSPEFDPDKTIGVSAVNFDPDRIRAKQEQPKAPFPAPNSYNAQRYIPPSYPAQNKAPQKPQFGYDDHTVGYYQPQSVSRFPDNRPVANSTPPSYGADTFNDHYQDDYQAGYQSPYNDDYSDDYQTTPPQKRKKGCGCLISVFMLILVILAASFGVWYFIFKYVPTDNDLFNSKLVPVCKNDKWGYMNNKGDEVVKLKYDMAYDFSDNLGLVKKNDKYGFINKKGQEVIKCIYDEAYSFSDSMAVIKQGDKYGCINTDGNIVIEPDYDAIGNFSEGLAHVRIDGKSGFIDKEGNVIAPLEYDYAYDFSDGLALVNLNGKYGYIDNEGDIIIKCELDDAYSFSEGLAAVCYNGKWGYIDTNGDLIVDFVLSYAENFNEGYAAVKDSSDKYAFIDKNGGLITDFIFDGVKPFSDGHAAVYSQDKAKCGFIDTSGKLVINYKYSNAFSFNCGLAPVFTASGKYAFIKPDGEIAISTKYLFANTFYNDGYTVVANDEKKYVVINKKGKQIGGEYDKIGNAYCPKFCKNEDCTIIADDGSDYCSFH